MGRGRGHGTLFYVVIGIVGVAVAVALCRAFDYDPFGIIGWVIDSVTWLVTRIADAIYASPVFHSVVGR